MQRQDKGVRIFRADWVLPIVAEPIRDGAVAVQGDTIVRTGPADGVVAAYPGAEIVEFHHAILLPGFVNCHSHLEYAVFRGLIDNLDFGRWLLQFIDYQRRLSAEDYAVSSRLGVSECVSSGITTVADSMYSGTSIDAIKQAGVRAIVYQEAFGMDDSRLPETMASLAAAIDKLDEQQDELVDVGIFPHSTYTVSAHMFRAVAELARERGKRFGSHLAESKDESVYIRSGSGVLAMDLREKVGWENIMREPFGVTPVKYLQQWDVYGSDFIAVHCVRVSDRDVEILARSDVAIAHCPKSNAKLGCGIAPLPEFLKAGIRVGFGTDSPASSNIMDMFGEMRTAIFLHRGVSRSAAALGADQCVQIATLGGARALGMDDRIGSLEAGKQADLIAVDMEYSHFTPIHDPCSALVYGANQEDVFFAMVAGRTIYDKKVLLTMDEEKTFVEARAVKAKLWG
ncbi:MAG: amidohydrolase [Actinomycetota bacterium]|jgi:5-methylthioadenosine/S-adenosylhomocysteine deaminase|nr:amidohydrolase [Actinomycetota bacterium]MCL6092907.1 amidohydrolase [Actinomycetota bacterium]MDA8166479.1 amidohydrolase [Actinomycetota bacterium]